jgi:peptidoglycan/LPS O-acetylase OafA/YrhL
VEGGEDPRLKSERFQELDVLRGVAALFVVLFHYSGHVEMYFGDFPFRFEAGKYGVSLFFCVSGFVIFWTLERSKTLSDFAFSRFSRLYPTYWAAILLWWLVTVVVFKEKFWPLAYYANLTMLQSFVGIPDLSEPFWTLGIELAFYCWMAVLFRAGWLKHIVPICVGWLVASAVWARTGEVEVWRTYLVLQYAPFFTAGIMFYLMRGSVRREYVLVIALAWLVVTMRGGLTGAMVATSCFAAMALAISGGLRWLVNPVTVMLGTVSYALYVTHSLAIPVLTSLHEAGMPSVTSVPLMVLAAIGLAAAVTYGIEKPAMRALRAWWNERYFGRTISATTTQSRI